MTTVQIAALDPTLSVGMVGRGARGLSVTDQVPSLRVKRAYGSSRHPADYSQDEVKAILDWGLGSTVAKLILAAAESKAPKPAPEPTFTPRPGSLESAWEAYMKDQPVRPVHEPNPSLRTAVSRIVVAYGLPRGDVPGAWRKLYHVYEQVYFPILEPAKRSGRTIIDQVEYQGGMLNLLLLASGLFGGHIKAA